MRLQARVNAAITRAKTAVKNVKQEVKETLQTQNTTNQTPAPSQKPATPQKSGADIQASQNQYWVQQQNQYTAPNLNGINELGSQQKTNKTQQSSGGMYVPPSANMNGIRE